jgi:hypothetical protein
MSCIEYSHVTSTYIKLIDTIIAERIQPRFNSQLNNNAPVIFKLSNKMIIVLITPNFRVIQIKYIKYVKYINEKLLPNFFAELSHFFVAELTVAESSYNRTTATSLAQEQNILWFLTSFVLA